MTTRTLLPALLLAGLALSSGGALAQEGRTIAIEAQLHEFSYGLHLVPERIDARVGDTLAVTVVNLGASRHNLLFCGDEPSGSNSCSDLWAKSALLAENQSETLTVKVQKPGTFQFWCDLPGHKQGGMVGELIVTGEAPRKTLPAPGALPTLLAALAAVAAVLVLRRR